MTLAVEHMRFRVELAQGRPKFVHDRRKRRVFETTSPASLIWTSGYANLCAVKHEATLRKTTHCSTKQIPTPIK